MRILHISDLHFGVHDTNLAKDLVRHVEDLKPRRLVCTGDISTNRERHELERAYAYLNELSQKCAGGTPRLIVVPGNHDIREQGFLWKSRRYADVFEGHTSDWYYPDDRLWVFGFDSAKNGDLGGAGEVDLADVSRFHDRYAELSRAHPDFAGAFKIVAVHHHPLPVRWDKDETQKWLTMTNAGAFLSAVLSKEIDVVLHGHEHVQCRSRLWSTLGAGKHEVQVLSLGATLRTVQQPNQNWFAVIDINGRGSAMRLFASHGEVFVPDETIPLRTIPETAALHVQRAADTVGYVYRAVASITDINQDGDAKRSIEFDELELQRPGVERSTGHPVTVPPTSGYLDKLSARSNDQHHSVSVHSASVEPRPKSLTAQLRFEPPLGAAGAVSYACSWYAVNSFALDEQQWTRMYGTGLAPKHHEFTQYIVEDPIEQLTVVAKFPLGSQPMPPRLFVKKVGGGAPEQWPHVGDVEGQLKADRALRYYESLGIAALRVSNPERGLSYGIGWAVPPSASKKPRAIGEVRALQDQWTTSTGSKPAKARIETALGELIALARKTLMVSARNGRPWPGPAEASFMFLNKAGQLEMLVGVLATSKGVTVRNYGTVLLPFGDGIAGRAFKANAARLHVADEDDSKEPNFYTPLPNVTPHKVLLCIPVQAPQNDELVEPYGVFSLASERADCPLRDALSASVEWADRLAEFRRITNERLFNVFLDAYLEDGAEPLPPAGTEE